MVQIHYKKLRNSLSQFRIFNEVKKYPRIVITCIVLFAIITSVSHLSKDTSNNYQLTPVNKLSDLFKINLDSSIKNQYKHNSYITYADTLPHSYIPANVTGFVSNLDHTKYMKDDFSKLYKDVIDCNDLQHNGILRYQVNERKHQDDLIGARREILSWNNEISKKVQNKEEEKKMSEEEIIDKHWFEFGHMSVWVESEQCYLTYSRIIYTVGAKNLPEISLIRATAFDKDWNEIKDKRVPYLDIVRPDNLDEEIKYLDEQLGLNKCKEFENKPKLTSEYDDCMIKHNKHQLKNQRRKQEILDKYFLTYPTVLNFEFKTRPGLGGPEDPHVIMRKNTDGSEEPIIVFNLDDGSERKIHSILPHRRMPTLVKFLLPDTKALKSTEKNWSPFLHPNADYNYSELSRGYIHFVYSLSPIRILRCSLDDGSCTEEFSKETLGLSDNNNFDGLRGGTQFVPLPRGLPGVKGKNIWVSFGKTHTKNCGCGPKFYRPTLVVMIEEKGIYHLELVAPGIDFGIEPLNFGMSGTSCNGANVLTPNSIVSWYVASQDRSKHSFEDYLTITVSEADAVTKRVVVKGVLDYILNIYKTKHINEAFQVNDETDAVIDSTRRCVKDYTFDVCKKYGETHPEN
ncbi:hypothetical protein MOUN0_A03796 [Monosporozyma unispora]|nr:hypothetical protein C6P44_004975 [Kazachstania unispora]